MRELAAEEIRVLLARRRISASELARRIGVTQPYISRRLTGEIALDVDDLQAIADALGVAVVELLPASAKGGPRAIARYLNVAERTTPNGRQPNSTRPTPVRPPAPTRPDTPRPGDTRPTTRTAVLPRAARRRAA